MGWRSGEVWLDADMLWFREQPGGPGGLALAAPAAAFDVPELPRSAPRRRASMRPVVGDSRPRRRGGAGSPRAPSRPSRSSSDRPRCSRSARSDTAGRAGGAADGGPAEPHVPAGRLPLPALPRSRCRAAPRPTAEHAIEWRRATSVGLQYAGRLVDGTQLPRRGARLGHVEPEHGLEPEPSRPALRSRAHDPDDRQRPRRIPGRAPRRTTGRRRRHQPPGRRDDGPARLASERAGRGRVLPAARQAPRRADHGAPDRPAACRRICSTVSSLRARKIVFVGFSTGLHGPNDVVVPYPSHENHMHVRFRAPVRRSSLTKF